MDLYILSSIAHFNEIVEGKSFGNGPKPESFQFVTRDWFVEQEVKKAGYNIISLDNNLDKAEIEKLTRQEMDSLNDWYKDKQWDDFSLYRGISLADSANHHFYHDIFSHIFNLIPNIQKLIKRFSPKKIIYEYNIAYRNSLNFNFEDKILKLACDCAGIEFSCIHTERLTETDQFKYDHSDILNKDRRAIIQGLTVNPFKGKLLDLLNYIHTSVFYRTKKFLSPRPSIFTDSSRGTNYFRKYWQNKYHFISNRRFRPLWSFYRNTSYVLRAHKRAYKRDELDKIMIKWQHFLNDSDDSHFQYFGVNLKSYFKEEVNWAIDNVFPCLMEVVDKGLWLFAKVKIDILFSQDDSTINGRYLCHIAKSRNVPVFVHPDGMRNSIEPPSRFSEYKLLFSRGMMADFRSEGFTRNLHIVGDPWLQISFGNNNGNSVKSSQQRPLKILICLKLDVPQVLGNDWSSSMRYLENILRGIDPVQAHFEVTCRNFPGTLTYMRLLKNNYFKAYPFHFQSADDVPFEKAIDEFDICITSWSTTAYESAIRDKIVIYYSDTNMFNYAPFDGKSELATASSPDEMTGILQNILEGNDSIYRIFNNPEVLEKYTGHLKKSDSVVVMDKVISKVIHNGINK